MAALPHAEVGKNITMTSCCQPTQGVPLSRAAGKSPIEMAVLGASDMGTALAQGCDAVPEYAPSSTSVWKCGVRFRADPKR